MYTLLVTGDVPGASTYFNPLLQQTTVPCTSGTRPSSPPDGMRIYETDTRTYRAWNSTLSAWISDSSNTVIAYTPTLTAATSNPTMGTGAIRLGWYSRSQGNLIDYHWWIKFGTSGSAAGSGQYQISLPVTALGVFGTAAPESTGNGIIRDDSATNLQQASWYIPGSDLTVAVGMASNGVLRNDAPWTWANLDYIQGSIRYRAAS